jgi:hypothetical protein
LDKLNEDLVKGRVMAKLSYTSETAIAITFLVMNLSTWLRRIFCAFLCLEPKITPFHLSLINKSYRWVHIKQYQLMSATALNPLLIFLSRSRTYSASPNYFCARSNNPDPNL